MIEIKLTKEEAEKINKCFSKENIKKLIALKVKDADAQIDPSIQGKERQNKIIEHLKNLDDKTADFIDNFRLGLNYGIETAKEYISDFRENHPTACKFLKWSLNGLLLGGIVWDVMTTGGQVTLRAVAGGALGYQLVKAAERSGVADKLVNDISIGLGSTDIKTLQSLGKLIEEHGKTTLKLGIFLGGKKLGEKGFDTAKKLVVDGVRALDNLIDNKLAKGAQLADANTGRPIDPKVLAETEQKGAQLTQFAKRNNTSNRSQNT